MIFKTIQQMPFTILSHYLQKTATAKLYILTNYFLSVYIMPLYKREAERKKEGLLQ